MNKILVTTMMGLGMLYAQSVSATAMVHHQPNMVVADASTQSGKTIKRHHRKHHRHHRQHSSYNCPDASCAGTEQPVYMRNQMVSQPDLTLDQVENNMEIIDRDHAARAGRGR